MKTITTNLKCAVRKLLICAFLACIALTDGMAQVQLSEDFEAGLPTGYTGTTSYSLDSGNWTGQANGVIRGTSGKVSGSYSLQLRNQVGAQVTTPVLANGGVSTVSFYASSSTATGSVQVNYSVDGGAWQPATGSPFTVASGTPVLKTATINSSSNNIRVQFYRTSSTIYIDDVEILASAMPTLNADATALPDFGSINIGESSAAATFEISGQNLNSTVTVSASSTSFEVSADNITFSQSFEITNSGSLTDVPVYVRFTPQTAGEIAGSISISATGAADTVSVSGTGVSLEPYFETTALQFPATCVGAVSGSSFQLEGFNLNSGVVTVGPADGFTFSATNGAEYTPTLTLTPTEGTLSQQIFVHFSPTALQSYNDGIVISGAGAQTTVSVTAEAVSTPATAITGAVSLITASSATLAGTFSMGCSAVASYGILLSTNDQFIAPSQILSADNAEAGAFSVFATGLQANTLYFYKAYVTDGAGTTYGAVSTFTTSNVGAPVALAATNEAVTSFTANWQPVSGATGYSLDVSLTPTFAVDGGIVDLAAWTFPESGTNTIADVATENNVSSTLSTNASSITSTQGESTQAATATNWNNGSNSKYWEITVSTVGFSEIAINSVQRSSNTGPRDFKLQYRIGAATWNDVPNGAITVGNDWTSGIADAIALPADASNQSSVSIRWIMTSNTSVSNGVIGSGGTSRIDTISVTGSASESSFVDGYEDLEVGDVTSYEVTGLTQGTTYYFRVRATTSTSTSANSNVVAAMTTVPALSFGSVAVNGPVCDGESATFTLSGLLENTNQIVHYTIGQNSQTAEVASNDSGEATFTLSLDLEMNGEELTITMITRTDGTGAIVPASNNSVTVLVNENQIWYADADNDGFGDATTSITSCVQPENYVLDNTDCNDASAAVNPNATEVPGNGIDENCNGMADDEIIGETTQIKASQCGGTLARIYSAIVAIANVPNVTLYTFEVTGPGNQVQEISATVNYFQLTDLTNYEYGTQYSIRVGLHVNGVWQGYGAACTVNTPVLALQLSECGTTLAQRNTPIFITGGNFVSAYEIRVTNLSTLASQTITRNVLWFKLKMFTGIDYDFGTQYQIEVRGATTGQYGEWSESCTVSTPSNARIANNVSAAFKAVASPNPFSNVFSITTDAVTDVTVKIYDLTGKLLDQRVVAAEKVADQQLGANFPAGVYNVVISQKGTTQSLRVIKR